jgi:DNA-binding NarL/FixJ family response regulator
MTPSPSPSRLIRVPLADDQLVGRGGLTMMVGCNEGVEVMRAASAGVEALEPVRGEEPDP